MSKVSSLMCYLHNVHSYEHTAASVEKTQLNATTRKIAVYIVIVVELQSKTKCKQQQVEFNCKKNVKR